MKVVFLALGFVAPLVLISMKPQLAWAEKEEVSSLHLQTTAVTQSHGDFASPYVGANSLNDGSDSQTSLTWTIFGAAKLGSFAEIYVSPEMAGGSGFDRTRGIAGFPNAEVYRVDDGKPKWNLARLYIKKVFALGGANGATEELKASGNQLAETVAVQRFTVALGKFALNDFLDQNSFSHDQRTQFLNWAFMDYGAWDYAADTKGYSWGLVLEYNEAKWALRFATALEPIRANETELDRDYPNHRGDNLEFEYRDTVLSRPATFRLLAFDNHANMGNYRTAINTTTPQGTAKDVTASRASNEKYGFGLGGELAITDNLGAFLRASWNDGATETWAFTEIDRSLSIGLSLKGAGWQRPDDVVGLGFVINGLSNDHRDYLAAGGSGFMLGDGKLNYAPEQIGELFASFRVIEGLHFRWITSLSKIQDTISTADQSQSSRVGCTSKCNPLAQSKG